MAKSFTGIAAAAALFIIAAPAPAGAFAVRHAAGIQADQGNTVQVWHRGRAHYRVYRRPYAAYRAYPRAYAYPYAYASPYAYAPYPRYRRYYAPGAYVGFGPFGFGIW